MDLGDDPTASSPTWMPNTHEVEKMCNFQPITHHISEMVQNRDTVTLEVE